MEKKSFISALIFEQKSYSNGREIHLEDRMNNKIVAQRILLLADELLEAFEMTEDE